MNIETPEQLKALHAKYPISGALAVAEDSITTWHYDQAGNQLVITVQTGQPIQYKEISVTETKEVYWDDEAATYKHRKRNL